MRLINNARNFEKEAYRFSVPFAFYPNFPSPFTLLSLPHSML